MSPIEFFVTDAGGLEGDVRFTSHTPTAEILREQFGSPDNDYGTYFLLRCPASPDITAICTESIYVDDLEDGEYKVYIDADLVSENATRTEVLHLFESALQSP